jgi:hypothetical protein
VARRTVAATDAATANYARRGEKITSFFITSSYLNPLSCPSKSRNSFFSPKNAQILNICITLYHRALHDNRLSLQFPRIVI